MLRILSFFVAAFLLTGCVGPMYQTPNVTSTEVKALEEVSAKDAKPLVIYERSDKYYIGTLKSISSRLQKNAVPLCKDSGYESCYFHVSYNPESTVNAYASERYKITLYKGLLQYLKTNDEIAAVIAHEMGHHLAKHNEKQQQNAETGAAVSGIITAILIGAANANNPYYNSYQQQQDQNTLNNMMKVGAEIGALSYSKEQEREADLLSAYLLSRSGYDLRKAENLMLVLARFAGEAKASTSSFLSTHPAGMERVVAWEKVTVEIKANKKKLPYRVEEKESHNPIAKENAH
ncbi:MAG: M48 family metallopeptidase [Pseudobdellovibrionaceae bacterium]